MARRRTTQAQSRMPVLGPKHAKYVRETRHGGRGRVPSHIPADHIAFLEKLGLPLASQARDAGISVRSLRHIAHQDYATSHATVTKAILAVDFHPNPRQEMVLAIGALRRIRALSRLGWSYPAIAEHAGVAPADLPAMHKHRTIAWETWAAIRDTYETLSSTPATSRHAHLTRKAAERKGWPAPLDWEDHDIDDPRVQVRATLYQPPTTADLRAAQTAKIAELTEAGHSAAEIAARLGVSQRSVTRHRAKITTAA